MPRENTIQVNNVDKINQEFLQDRLITNTQKTSIDLKLILDG
jgi:hypothetical protein